MSPRDFHTMKTCFKCLTAKPLSEFYVHAQMRDGHLNKCKSCTKQDVRKNVLANSERYRAYHREKIREPEYVAKKKAYRRTKRGQQVVQRANAKYRELRPEARAAHTATWCAIRKGEIVKQPCEVCGDRTSEAHHDDYSKPLDVRWLCIHHHKQHHRELRT